MIRSFCRFTTLAITVFIASTAMSQQPVNPTMPKADTAKKPTGPVNGPKPYKEVITAKAVSDAGLFWVHKVEDKYFFEIPDSLFNRDILAVNRISKAAAGMRSGSFFGYGGDQIGQNVIRFEKGPNNKIFLRTISYAEYAKDSTSPMFTSVNNSNVQPIVASFDIKSLGKDSTGAVIDITDFINGDNDVLFFNSGLKSSLRFAAIQSDKSYISSVKSYPINVEIKTVKTYARSAAPSAIPGLPTGGGGNMTVELNSSLVLLPKLPMQSRYFDPRVGYFAVGYTDFDANPQGVKNISIVKRWRLEPKEEDMEKYKRGELVEPRKPIIFYIDPATPKKWVPYLMQGVDDWKAAFEKAGFKNAIMAKLAPTKAEDSTWSLEDARNSAIVYKPSDIPNASGPSISDPRSGEIMESHINWYHNVMQLIHDWYFVQTAAVDPKARKMTYDDELMGQLIRFVSSHEVGHTIGLRHNFGSSSSVPTENLRNKTWVEANGHTPSIMDYARFNYVAQPEDNISQVGLFPRIGDYDNWAIEWGYKLFPQYKDAEAEKGHINKWISEKLKNHRLWWGDGESNQDDSRSQTEDLSEDAVKASTYGIKNLQRILPQLIQWTKEDNEDYSNLNNMYNQVSSQFTRYMGHVARHVGSIYKTPKMVEDAGPVYETEPEAKQKEAVDFLNKQLFATPSWLINTEIYSKTGLSGLSVIGNIQDNILNRLLSIRTLTKLVDAEAALGNNAYQVVELFSDLKKGIWTELAAKKPVDIFRRNLQKSYVNILSNLINPPSATSVSIAPGITITSTSNDKSDITSVVRAHLAFLRNEVNAAAAVIADPMTKYHLQDISRRIDKALNPKN
ncbi:MAG: zinc-dependent metalloprotease [Sphingobacteriales bacterium]|nr:zinc-dependent metalloprotease [Sphingobacteriales bacterium]